MHRVRTLVALAAVALVLGVAPASAATTYQLVGLEINPSPATFVGTLVDRPGTWRATILHAPLNTTPGGTTAITGGSFSITTFSPYAVVAGAITGGQLTAGPVQVVSPFSCTQRFAVVGSLTAGSFAGVLMHYGFPSSGKCIAFAATFAGSATL
jgi:hypothetical protein